MAQIMTTRRVSIVGLGSSGRRGLSPWRHSQMLTILHHIDPTQLRYFRSGHDRRGSIGLDRRYAHPRSSTHAYQFASLVWIMSCDTVQFGPYVVVGSLSRSHCCSEMSYSHAQSTPAYLAYTSMTFQDTEWSPNNHVTYRQPYSRVSAGLGTTALIP